MKITNLAYITRSQLTALATAMSQIKLAGFRGTPKTLINVFAKLESLDLESFLNSIDKKHKESYVINKKVASFFKDKDGTYQLATVSVNFNVTGFTDNYISIYQSSIHILDKEKKKIILDDNIYPNISSGGRNDSSLSTKEKNSNLQFAINKAFEICEDIINNRISSVEYFKNTGWEIELL